MSKEAADKLLIQPSSPAPSSAAAGSPRKRSSAEGRNNNDVSPLPNKKMRGDANDAAYGLPEHGGDAYAVVTAAEEQSTDTMVEALQQFTSAKSPTQSNRESVKELWEDGEGNLDVSTSSFAEPSACQSNERTVETTDVTDNDIVVGNSGRGWGGYEKYRKLVGNKKALYQAATTRAEKASIVSDVIRELKSQDPPSRFLTISGKRFIEVVDDVVREKVRTALYAGSKKNRDSNESNGTAVSFSDEDQPKEISGESVHMAKKENFRHGHDVLSFYASTPFDAESMLSLQCQKECGVLRECLILPSRANLPIIPQKKFMKSKAPAKDDAVNNDPASLESPTSEVANEVSKFLKEEEAHLKTGQDSIPPRGSYVEASYQAQVNKLSKDNLPEWLKEKKELWRKQRRERRNLQIAFKTAIASMEIDSSTTDLQTASLPVAFGFHLNDDASKQSAQAAAEQFKAHGKKAAGGKNGISVCNTPKVKKTSDSNTPKTPKTPALLLSTEATPNLPGGWVTKTYQRMSGNTSGTKDKYFFSPQKEIKFRSMKSCKAFIQILNEPGVDGNEGDALKLFKERGHKF